jgi:hypothetical protein
MTVQNSNKKLAKNDFEILWGFALPCPIRTFFRLKIVPACPADYR